MSPVTSFPRDLACTDAEDGTLQLECNPPAETSFTPGIETFILCLCRDVEDSLAVCSFYVRPGMKLTVRMHSHTYMLCVGSR